jgi:hypothetical protein
MKTFVFFLESKISKILHEYKINVKRLEVSNAKNAWKFIEIIYSMHSLGKKPLIPIYWNLREMLER